MIKSRTIPGTGYSITIDGKVFTNNPRKTPKAHKVVKDNIISFNLTKPDGSEVTVPLTLLLLSTYKPLNFRDGWSDVFKIDYSLNKGKKKPRLEDVKWGFRAYMPFNYNEDDGLKGPWFYIPHFTRYAASWSGQVYDTTLNTMVDPMEDGKHVVLKPDDLTFTFTPVKLSDILTSLRLPNVDYDHLVNKRMDPEVIDHGVTEYSNHAKEIINKYLD